MLDWIIRSEETTNPQWNVLTLQIWGHEIWHFVLPGNISAGRMFEMILYVSSTASNIPVVFYNIYTSYRDRTGYMRPFREAVRPLISMMLLFSLSLVWVLKSPILNLDPRAVYFLIGTIFSNICVSWDVFVCNISPKNFFVAVPSHRRTDEWYSVWIVQLVTFANGIFRVRFAGCSENASRFSPNLHPLYIGHAGTYTLRYVRGKYQHPTCVWLFNRLIIVKIFSNAAIRNISGTPDVRSLPHILLQDPTAHRLTPCWQRVSASSVVPRKNVRPCFTFSQLTVNV